MTLTCMALAALSLLGQNEFETFMKEYQAKRQDLRVLEAHYVERTIYPDETFETEGELLYAKPRRLVRRTADRSSTVLIDDQQLYNYEPAIKQLEIYDLGGDPSAEALFLGFEANLERVQEAYDVRMVEQGADPRGKKGLLLTPKAENLKESMFQEVTILLEDKTLLPFHIDIKTDDDSRLIYEVKNYVLNGTPDLSETQIILPEGTKIIRGEEFESTVGPGGKMVPDPALAVAAPAEVAPKIESTDLPPAPATP